MMIFPIGQEPEKIYRNNNLTFYLFGYEEV